MLGYQSYQHRRTFDVDSCAVLVILQGHWTLTGAGQGSERHDLCLQDIRDMILCGATENSLAEKLSDFDHERGARADLYTCHLTARELLAL